MAAAGSTSAKPRRRPRASAAVERQLLDEVLELKDQVHNLAVAIEHHTNAVAQTQMLSARDIVALSEKDKEHDKRLGAIEHWQGGIEQERAEQRGAARVRKSLLAIVAGVAGLLGSGVGVFLNWLLRGGG